MNHPSISHLAVSCLLLFAGGCADSSCISDTDTPVLLQPAFSTVSASSTTRTIVSETGTADGKVSHIGVCLTLNSDGHTAYANPSVSSALFTLGEGGDWTASHPVNLRSIPARLYAWYPATTDALTTTDNGTIRTVPITLSASQTFDGASTTACSQTDYLYGSAGSTVGDVTAITVSNTANNPTIYLQHALAQLVFTIEYKSGRVPDAEYDWVKKISLEGPFHTGDATMQLSDGTLTFPAHSSDEFTFEANSNPQLPGNIGDPKRVAYGLVAPKAATTDNTTLKLVLGQQSGPDNDRTLTVTTSFFNGEWKKGVRYVYNLLLDKNDLTLKNVAIEGWTEIDSGGSTEFPPLTE